MPLWVSDGALLSVMTKKSLSMEVTFLVFGYIKKR